MKKSAFFALFVLLLSAAGCNAKPTPEKSAIPTSSEELAKILTKSYYYQRASLSLEPAYAGKWSRAAGHPDTHVAYHPSTGHSEGFLSSPGGWYDAGDYNKYVVNAGISVGQLLAAHEAAPGVFADGALNIPESGNGQNDLLDEVKWELDWMKTMQDTDGGVFFKITSKVFCGMVMPAADNLERWVVGKSTTSALDFAAVMAMASRVYATYNAAYAADCLARAERAWGWAVANPSVAYRNPSDISTGEYGDGTMTDEFFWAAVELAVATGDAGEYKSYVQQHIGDYIPVSEPSWGFVAPLGITTLAFAPDVCGVKARATEAIVDFGRNSLRQIAQSPTAMPHINFNWGSNSGVANTGVLILCAYRLTGDKAFLEGAKVVSDYLLGSNATGYCFITGVEGIGEKSPMNPHHRPSAADGIAEPVPGFVVGGPNGGRNDEGPGVVYPDHRPEMCYVDVTESYASNEVAINWNAPAILFYALYNEE
ncbi:MAG: glycoside hydrolase family 9 protein [Rikenellaceae bacterium]|jgi:endoglucanase|nr:glycoside hydrolase family 9 protein [Rikenellaceae bacterium]